MAVNFEEFCERLGNLRLDRRGGLAKPYKPLLVAAVVILIHKGKQPTRDDTQERTGTRRRSPAAEWNSLDARGTAGLAARSSRP